MIDMFMAAFPVEDVMSMAMAMAMDNQYSENRGCPQPDLLPCLVHHARAVSAALMLLLQLLALVVFHQLLWNFEILPENLPFRKGESNYRHCEPGQSVAVTIEAIATSPLIIAALISHHHRHLRKSFLLLSRDQVAVNLLRLHIYHVLP